MSRTWITVVVLATIIGCADTTSEPNPKESGDAGPQRDGLRISLSVEAAVVKNGNDARFKAFLVNDGLQPVTVVLPGDGSDCGWRSPIVRWHPEQQEGRRCGNVNGLKDDEVVTLKPGEQVQLGWLGWPQLNGVGKHRVQVELEHVPDLEWVGIPLGAHHPDAMARVRQAAPFKAISNIVEVTVSP